MKKNKSKKKPLPPSVDPNTTVGTKIRQRRRAIDKTLKEVAQACNLSIGFLSQIERGACAPSLSSLFNIAKALDTTIETFVRSPRQHGVVSRKGERERFNLGEKKRSYEVLGPGFPDSSLHACIVHRPAGHVSEMMRNDGEEIVYILKGSVMYEIDGQRHHLNAGDSVHFQSNQPHRSTALGSEAATELWVGTLPIFPSS